MRIDERVEARVRESYSAVVGRDADRMVAAFEGLDPAGSVQAIQLGVFVVGFIMKDCFHDGPTEADVREVAHEVIDAVKDWIDLGEADEVATFLLSASRADMIFPGVPKEDVVGLTFVCGGYLLASRSRETQRWYEYLDEIWGVLEATPEPTA
jgi:hypothetical protein